MALVEETAGLNPGSSEEGMDTFSQNSRRISALKAWCESKNMMNSMAPDGATAVDDIPGEVSMDFLDDAWLKDIVGPWDFQFQPQILSALHTSPHEQ